jgi:glycosyltransferase involved in cell wall biosynthesis
VKSYFILPIFNKEFLIEKVLDGIVNNTHGDFKIIAIIDGCTDNSKQLVLDYIDKNKLQNNFIVKYQDNVHEITCLNYGLSVIKLLNPDENDLIFTVQDDVILQEPNIDNSLLNLFSNYQDIGYVSMRLGAELNVVNNNLTEYNNIESEFGHWNQLGLSNYKKIFHHEVYQTEIVIRSPTCVLWKRYNELGFYDSTLAPCGYDCHDFSIRNNKAGYRNLVYALKFESKIEWGGMRKEKTELNSKHGNVYEWNRQYLIKKHKDYWK